MKLIQTVVSAVGFRDAAGNRERLELLAHLAELTRREDAQLLLLPAGYLTARSEDGVGELVARADQIAQEEGIAVIGGVDVEGPVSKHSRSIEDLVTAAQLPWFGFAAGQGVTAPYGALWRQTSSDNVNADLLPDDTVPGPERAVTVDGVRIAVLVCGELFSWRAHDSIGGAGVGLVVDLGHVSMGQGLIPAMLGVANKRGCPVVHSQHLKGWGSLHFVNGEGEQQSVAAETDHVLEHGSLWAAWAERTVTVA